MENLIITLIQTIGFAIVWRMAGDGHRRYWFFILGGLLLMLSVSTVWELVGLAGAMTLLRTLPTGHMFAAIHGQPQKVLNSIGKSKRFDFIANIAWRIHLLLPAIKAKNIWYRYGIIYAAVRNSLALPFIILSGHYGLVVFLLAGFVYYGFGKLARDRLWVQPVMLAEICQGAAFGLML